MGTMNQDRLALDANTRNWLTALHDDAPESSTTRVRSGRLLAHIDALAAELEAAREALRAMEEPCPDCGGGGCGWCGNTGHVLKPAPEVAAILHRALAGGEQT